MDLPRKIKSRLDELGLNAFEAARRAGLERGSLNDLIIGRKKSIRGHNAVAVAEVLNVDVDWLLGQAETPRAFSPAAREGGEPMPLAGQIEGGTWREEDPLAGQPSALCVAPGWSAEDQLAFMVMGDVGNAAGIVSGMIVGVVRLEAYVARNGGLKDGALVVVERERDTLRERTIRIHRKTAAGPTLATASTNPKHLALPYPSGDTAQNVRIVGVIVRAIVDLDA